MAQTFNLPTLPSAAQLFDPQGRPTATMQQYWQQYGNAIASTLNAILAIPEIQTQLAAAQAAAAANAASAAAANAAAAAANAAASTAQGAAAAAAAAQAASAREVSLQTSYISPDSVLTATPSTITVAAHTRYYGDGTTAHITAGPVAATAPGQVDYVSYSDPTRAGGSVTFIASATAPTQTGDTHVVGAITVPTTGTSNGGSGPRKPGYVTPDE